MSADLQSLGARFIRPTDLHIPPAGADPRNAEVVRRIPLAAVRPAPWQPRRHFDPGEIEQLAASMRSGLIHPVVVRALPGASGGEAGGYELIVGERRWRAAQLNAARDGVADATIEARIVTVEDSAARRMTLVENEARANKSPWEVALAYRELRAALEECQASPVTQAEIAAATPHGEASVNEYLRIADGVTEDALRDAGFVDGAGDLDFAAVARLNRTALLQAARCDDRAACIATLRAHRGGRRRTPKRARRWTPAQRAVNEFLQSITVLSTEQDILAAVACLDSVARDSARDLLSMALRAIQAAAGQATKDAERSGIS